MATAYVAPVVPAEGAIEEEAGSSPDIDCSGVRLRCGTYRITATPID